MLRTIDTRRKNHYKGNIGMGKRCEPVPLNSCRKVAT